MARARRRADSAESAEEIDNGRLECNFDDLCVLCLALAIAATATKRRLFALFGVLCFLILFLIVASPGERLSRLLFARSAARESDDSDDTAAVCALSHFSDSTACWGELANAYEAAHKQLNLSIFASAEVSSASVNATVAQVIVRFLNHSVRSVPEYRYSPKLPGALNRTRNLTTASIIVAPPALSVKPTYRGSLAPQARSQYRIPPIIHQQLLAENALVPGQYREMVASVVEKHRHLDYWLWHTDELLALVMERRPETTALLARAPRRVHRSDILRYLTVYEEGGFYMDLDMRAHRAIDPLLRRYECVIGREPDAMSLYIWSQSIVLTNAAFGARARHPFLGFLLERLRDRDVSGHVVGATGPLFMTDTFFEWARNRHCPLPSFERLHRALEPLLVCDCALLPWYIYSYTYSYEFEYELDYQWSSYKYNKLVMLYANLRIIANARCARASQVRVFAAARGGAVPDPLRACVPYAEEARDGRVPPVARAPLPEPAAA